MANISGTQCDIENSDGWVPPAFHLVSQWFIFGLDDPFGKVSGHDTTKVIYGMTSKKYSEIITYTNLMVLKSSLSFIQSNLVNCGVCCTLFVFDILVTQSLNLGKAFCLIIKYFHLN